MPTVVVTVTCTVPVPGGVTARISVSDSTRCRVAGVVPKVTAVAPENPVPVRATDPRTVRRQ